MIIAMGLDAMNQEEGGPRGKTLKVLQRKGAVVPECSNPASFPVYCLDPFYWRGSEYTGKNSAREARLEQLLQVPDM